MSRIVRQAKAPGLIAGFVAFLAVAAYSAWALVQILVLNPLAAVPGVSLQQIYADVEAAGQSMDVWLVVTFLAVGPLATLAIAVLATIRSVSPWLPSMVGLALLALGPVAYWWASFAPGMGLADTYLISGGDHSPWAWPLVIVSLLAFVALVALGVRGLLHSRRRTALERVPSPA